MCKMVKVFLLLALWVGAVVIAREQACTKNIRTKTPLGIVTKKHKKGLSLKESKALTLHYDDLELGMSGKIRIEHFLQKNANMLNKQIPDELEFFKERLSLMFDGSYGQKKYGYKAAQMYAELRHRGVWGKALSYADKDAGAIGPSALRFNQQDETLFGAHNHTSGKTLIWFNEAWLQFSPNAVAGSKSLDYLHFLKLGWFEFSLGRGIALGGMYGTNKENLGLHSYPEEKGAPGINLHGTMIKDTLAYDLYYAKFEERNNSFADCINLNKQYIVGLALPFRGEAKDNDCVAMRVQWTPLAGKDIGNLEIEPYAFYNAASDQRVERPADADTKWGAYGLGVEYVYNDFEVGGESAFNYGHEKLYNIDRNLSVNYNNEGVWASHYTKIYQDQHKTKAIRSDKAIQASQYPAVNGQEIIDPDTGAGTGFYSASDRFRPEYFNKLRGWMAVLDGAYTVRALKLKLALSWGYASGDANPHDRDNEVNKTYRGFIGLHEGYYGKRVKAIFLLDERLLIRPMLLTIAGSEKAKAIAKMIFSDVCFVGTGITWTPLCGIRDLSINPNIICFWKVAPMNKFVADPTDTRNGGYISDQMARKYMGTEINVISKCTVLQDLVMYANVAFFIPGSFFEDVKGMPISGRDDIFKEIVSNPRIVWEDIVKLRLGTDTAYHVNIGFEYKF